MFAKYATFWMEGHDITTGRLEQRLGAAFGQMTRTILYYAMSACGIVIQFVVIVFFLFIYFASEMAPNFKRETEKMWNQER